AGRRRARARQRRRAGAGRAGHRRRVRPVRRARRRARRPHRRQSALPAERGHPDAGPRGEPLRSAARARRRRRRTRRHPAHRGGGARLMPARLLIEGGVPLKGDVAVSAAKNAALPAMAASLLTARPLTLGNVPELGDVRTMLKLLQTLGARVERQGRGTTLTVERVTSDVAPYDLVSTMRASVLVLGPL